MATSEAYVTETPAKGKGRKVSGPARTPGGGDTMGQLIRKSNLWRENYNPLRGLVLRRVVGLFECCERGDYAELQWLYKMVEKRFATLRSLIIRRRSALTKLDWDVKMVSELPGVDENSPDPSEKAKAKAMREMARQQRDYLKSRYELIENLKEAIQFLALAEFRGFAILNKWRLSGGPNDGAVNELHWLPQWNFARDGQFGEWYWNANAEPGATAKTLGEANLIDRQDFIIREVEMPINEIGLIAFVRSNLSQKDWDAFVEMFGIPGCVVVMPGNIPPGKEGEYKSAAQSVAEGASGAVPSGADVKFPSTGARQNSPFKEHLDYQKEDLVLAGTGGKLTMLTGPVGLGGKQSETHEDVFDEIATAEAGEISEIFQGQFDKAELEAQFPGQPTLAYFVLQPVDKTAAETQQFKRDTFKQWLADGTVSDVLANLTDLKALTEDVGLPVNEEYVDPYLPVADAAGALVTGEVLKDAAGDVIGALPKAAEPDPNAPTPGGRRPTNGKPGGEGNQIGNRGGKLKNVMKASALVKLEGQGVDELALAVQKDLAPVAERLQRIMSISEPALMEAKLKAFLQELEQLKNDLAADPAVAGVLQGLMNVAMADGLKRTSAKS